MLPRFTITCAMPAEPRTVPLLTPWLSEKQNLLLIVTFVILILAILINWINGIVFHDVIGVIPNVPIFLEIHIDAMRSYDLALRGNYSRELLNTRSAMQDLEARIRYSD